MVPAAFVMLDALPLTSNGKVDRRALPSPSTQQRALDTAYAEPQSGLEQTIAGIWQDVLNVERVGVHDNFFDLGGHSLLLTQAHARLKTVLNREFPVMAMFRHPTIDALSKFLRPDFQSLHKPLEAPREKVMAGRNRREQVFQKRKIAEQSKKSK
jgi:Phosphopantetheine attachment site